MSRVFAIKSYLTHYVNVKHDLRVDNELLEVHCRRLHGHSRLSGAEDKM